MADSATQVPISTVSLGSFLTLIAGSLKRAEIPFMLTGSLAAAFYGAPRATQDLDVVIDSQSDNLRWLVRDLQSSGLSQSTAVTARSRAQADFPARVWVGLNSSAS